MLSVIIYACSHYYLENFNETKLSPRWRNNIINDI